MTKIHPDTDIGGDMDDVCALAMILKWPDLEITGVTTVDEENWPEPVTRLPGSPDEALSLLKRSIEQGAVLVGTGQFTNFALLDQKYPGILKQAHLFLMGGYIHDIPPEYPQWTNEMDYNIQLDIRSAQYVLEHSNPILVPLTVSVQTALRRAYLPRLGQSGRLGELIVHQAERCARSEQNEQTYGETCPGLPRDIINFQHDPLTCAIALGWHEGVEVETVPLKLETRESWLYEVPDNDGLPTRLVTKMNGNAFNEYWCDILCR